MEKKRAEIEETRLQLVRDEKNIHQQSVKSNSIKQNLSEAVRPNLEQRNTFPSQINSLKTKKKSKFGDWNYLLL